MAQKSLLKIIQSVCAELNLPSPSSVISSNDKSISKLLALTRAECDVELAEFDWQMLQTRYVLTTVEGQDTYDFPSDIERFISGTFFDLNSRWELTGPLSARSWEMLKTTNLSTSPYTRYRIVGDKIAFYPTPDSEKQLAYEYVSNAIALDGSTGLPKSDFTQDSDICRFDFRTVVFGVKYRWLASIGQDTTASLIDYKRAFELAKGTDSPDQRLSLTGRSTCAPLLSTANIPDGNWSV